MRRIKARTRRVKNPFLKPGKKANFIRLLKAGYTPATAKRLVETNPQWNKGKYMG